MTRRTSAPGVTRTSKAQPVPAGTTDGEFGPSTYRVGLTACVTAADMASNATASVATMVSLIVRGCRWVMPLSFSRDGAAPGQLREHSGGNGLWEGPYWQDGRRRSVYAKTKREAQERLRTALSRVDRGSRPTNNRITVGQHLDAWLATHVETDLRTRTAESYQMMTRL